MNPKKARLLQKRKPANPLLFSTMENDDFKKRFVQILGPFIELLQHQREYVTLSDWLHLVRRDHARIISQPEQYLGQELPPPGVVQEVINEIFKDLIDEELESMKELVSIL
jgi:hypothetical protein